MPFFSLPPTEQKLVIQCIATATVSNLCEWRVICDQSWEKELRRSVPAFCHLDGKSFLAGEREASRRKPGKGNNWQQPIPPSTCRLETTEATGVFAFIFRFLFFFFLIALLGGALSFHLLALSVLCLLIYFAIYLVNNFFYLWARQGEKEKQRDREKERQRRGTPPPIYSPFFPSSILPSLSIATTSSLFYPCAAHAPSSLHCLPPPPL